MLGALEIGTGVKRLRIIADTGAEADSSRAVADERNRRERAVALGADAQSLPRSRPVSGIHLLLFAIEEQAHWRLRAARQLNGDASVIAKRRFGAKTAAHRIDNDADARERQAEHLGELLPHAGGELGGHGDGQAIRTPIGKDGMRLHAAMSLHLGGIFSLDDDIGLREALCYVASPHDRWTAHIAVQRQIGGCWKTRWMAGGCGRAVVDYRRVRFTRLLHSSDKRQRLVIDADQMQRFFGCRYRNSRDRGHGRTDIAQGCCRRIVRTGTCHDRAHAGKARRRGNIDGAHQGMRHRRTQDAAMQHTGQRHIHCEAGDAGDFGAAIRTRKRFSDHRELSVRWQRRRFVRRDSPLDSAEANAGDAGRKCFGAQRVLLRHDHPLRAFAASSVAAITCG